MNSVAKCAEVLSISEREVFEEAHRRYYGDSGDVRVSDDLFQYMHYNVIPPYVQSFLRTIGQLEA